MLRYDTSKWKNLDHSDSDAEGQAWTRLDLMMKADPMAQMFSDRVVEGIIALLVETVIGKRGFYGDYLNDGQAYNFGTDALMNSPMGAFGYDVCSRFAGLATRAWYPESYR